LSLWSNGQDKSEFEGRVYYTNHFNIKNAKIDSNQLIKFYGKNNVYSYKQGDYLWTYDGAMELELYLHGKGLLLNKYRNQDYYISRDVVKEVDNIISYTIQENADTICGYVCNAIHIITQREGTNNQLARTLYYNSEVALNPDHFKNYNSYAYSKLYQITRALPLKIVVEDEAFEITMEAEKVEKVPISDKELKQNKSLKVRAFNDN